MDKEEKEIKEMIEEEEKDLKPDRIYIILEDNKKNPLSDNGVFTEMEEEELDYFMEELGIDGSGIDLLPTDSKNQA